MRRTRSRVPVVTFRVSASSAGCAAASRSDASRDRCAQACDASVPSNQLGPSSFHWVQTSMMPPSAQ